MTTPLYWVDQAGNRVVTQDGQPIIFGYQQTPPAPVVPFVGVDFQLYEVELGSLVLYWSAVGQDAPPSFTLYQNGEVAYTGSGLMQEISGLLANTPYSFRLLANYPALQQSREIFYQWGSNEVMTVTPMRRWPPYPSVLWDG